MTSKGILIFIIPILFSFVYGTVVLGSAFYVQGDTTTTNFSNSIEILSLRSIYANDEEIIVQISVSDEEYDCGDLYITIYDVSGFQKKVVKQQAFFDQCLGGSGILPNDDTFSEKLGAGEYLLEAQFFDKNGSKSLSTSHNFRVE